MTPDYSREGKIEVPYTDAEFEEGMKVGHFVASKHRAFCILLYYSAVRKTEALRADKEQFFITENSIKFDVGIRLKHGTHTNALTLPLAAPFMNELKQAIEETPRGERVFPYSDKTAYNIVRRAFKYPHLFRLSRITNFFLEGWTIAQVKSWTGLTLSSLEHYVGLVDTIKMGESLAKPKQ
jgi:integrase